MLSKTLTALNRGVKWDLGQRRGDAKIRCNSTACGKDSLRSKSHNNLFGKLQQIFLCILNDNNPLANSGIFHQWCPTKGGNFETLTGVGVYRHFESYPK